MSEGRFKNGKPDNPSMGTFEAVQRPSSKVDAPSGAIKPAPYNWSINTVTELVRFRDEITAALPPIELGKLNLEEEMLLQYHALRELQNTVMADDDVPVNQRAQVANSVAATLKTLGDQQQALYTTERYKSIENLLIRHLSKQPEAFAEKFLEEYRVLLESIA